MNRDRAVGIVIGIVIGGVFPTIAAMVLVLIACALLWAGFTPRRRWRWR